ncbi:MAG: M48 family metallopeptidase [Phascolarctobacterium sp.]|nr:M48 family metallopeptidase [Phascolarctobacterium sp.]
MVLTVPPGTRREVRAALFRGFYFNEMKEALKRLITECEKRTGLHAEEVRISNMKSCWGSCSMKKKRISINLQLAKTPPGCLEYIVFHEMLHLMEKRHGRIFYGLLDEYYPAWREADRIISKLPLGFMAKNML